MKQIKDIISVKFSTDQQELVNGVANSYIQSVPSGSINPLYVVYPSNPSADKRNSVVKVILNTIEPERAYVCYITVYRQGFRNEVHEPSINFGNKKMLTLGFDVIEKTCSFHIGPEMFRFHERFSSTTDYLIECRIWDKINKYDTATYTCRVRAVTELFSKIPITSIFTVDNVIP